MEYNARVTECLFCRIVQKKVPADIVFESETVLGFKDIHPQAPVHVLLVPKAHVARLMDVGPRDDSMVAEIHRAARVLATELGLGEPGFRLVVNNGADAGQAVEHLHYHLLGGRRLSWPPG